MNQPLRIAIADDERDMREYMQELLRHLGYEVVGVAETGHQLVEHCQHAPPDLLITDIRMPDGDGMVAAELVYRQRPIPIIVVTGHDDQELIDRAGSGHVSAYLVKPIKQADLKSAITLALKRFQETEKLKGEAADLRQALEERKIIERAKGLLMKKGRLDEPEAFQRLKKLARDKNKKLIDVAHLILEVGEAFG